MHVTFDLSDIEETMPQQARKHLETELETRGVGQGPCARGTINIP